MCEQMAHSCYPKSYLRPIVFRIASFLGNKWRTTTSATGRRRRTRRPCIKASTGTSRRRITCTRTATTMCSTSMCIAPHTVLLCNSHPRRTSSTTAGALRWVGSTSMVTVIRGQITEAEDTDPALARHPWTGTTGTERRTDSTRRLRSHI
uniref:Uncharacterized protein n=1 Tax=Steinernema glaseri TaxID=37863 RepID=A0A1I7ZDI6_9BILA